MTEEITLSNLKQGLGENALVFLPESTTSKLDNVAYVMSNAFYAGRDIVLTDGKPFYSPYDIHVGSDNEAIYIRNVQRSDYEDDILVSMVLPYSLTVNNGVHTNPDNTSFSIFKMDEAKLFKLDTTTQDPVHNYGTSYFSKVGVNATTVNSPYMVNLDKTARESSSYAFAAIQKGATIVATTSMDNTGNYKYLFKGERVGGSVNNDNVPSGSVTLTPEGSYSGEIYDRAISNAIFYFADNKFLNLYKLMATKRYLYVYPFRAVYTFDGNLAPNTVKALNGLDISFDMPGETDGIIDRTISQVPDLAVRSGKGFIQQVTDVCAQNNAAIASIVGRFYAMDRDKRWERVKEGYDLIVKGTGKQATDMVQAMQESYDEGVTDEFIKPIHNAAVNGCIEEGDVVIFINFRNDRAKELTIVLTQQDMPEQGMTTIPGLQYYCMTPYDANFKGVHILFPKENVENTLGEYLSSKGKKQLHTAETEKYAHVTFFFNGGREAPFAGEDRILVASPKVATYDLKPEMSAYEVKDKLVASIRTQQYDFIVVNFANGDMVGHTGVYNAIAKAVWAVDRCVHDVIETAKKNDYEAIIIADHGNADNAINPDGTPNTAHSLNPVPFIYVTDNNSATVKDGRLADVAPSILHIMGLEQPKDMTGECLISDNVNA